MKEVTLTTFEEFESQAKVLLEDREKKRSEKGGYFSPVLFRGQAKASDPLKTSLEWHSSKQYTPKDYWETMRAVRHVVESFMDKRWPFHDNYSHNDSIPNAPQDCEFMVYLRHHGFPSPLLDWTRSFYVAAFFAFRSARYNDPDVAIYSLIEYYGEEKNECDDEGFIVGVGSNIRTHRRHFIQQSNYTYCTKRLPDGTYLYDSHEQVFERGEDTQDVLTKFIMPKTERPKVLAKLRMMNITAHSLFGSEESLLETLAYQEIE